jgi:hypothetical protein
MGEIAKAAQLMKDFMELGTKPSPLNIKLLLMNAKNAITSGGDLVNILPSLHPAKHTPIQTNFELVALFLCDEMCGHFRRKRAR